jgi:hypothetical protein
MHCCTVGDEGDELEMNHVKSSIFVPYALVKSGMIQYYKIQFADKKTKNSILRRGRILCSCKKIRPP